MKIKINLLFTGVLAIAVACQNDSAIEKVNETQDQNTVSTQSTQEEKVEETQDPTELGNIITHEAAKSLQDELLGAVYEEGPVNAVSYCNENALGITARIAKKHNAEIKRTALRLRNPANKPDSLEMVYLKYFSDASIRGEKPRPQMVEVNGKNRYFTPIQLQEVCLACHGKSNDISPKVAEEIAKNYPKDQATGYAIGDFRGMWSVTY